MKQFSFKGVSIVFAVLIFSFVFMSSSWAAPPGQEAGSSIVKHADAAGPELAPAAQPDVDSIVYTQGSAVQVVDLKASPGKITTAHDKSKTFLYTTQKAIPPDLLKLAATGKEDIRNCSSCHKIGGIALAKGINPTRSDILLC